MIDITKLNHGHIGRLVIDENKRIGTIVSITQNYLSVDYDGFLSIGIKPENLEFFDFIGGLTIEDIGSKWMSRNRNTFTFVGGEFSQTYNIEYLIFRHELVNREMRYTAMPKSLTRIEEKEEYTLVVKRKVSKEQYEAINKILQDENNAQ